MQLPRSGNLAQLNTSGPSPLRAFTNSSFITSVLLPAVVILAIVLAGVGTGWFLSKNGSLRKGAVIGNSASNVNKAPGAQVTEGGKTVGLNDAQTFRDNAEGTLQDGGIEGEGTHHLERPGGASQTVYLTSSVVDLDQFIDKKVQVWGETIAAKKAGWLMDVGKVKIIE